MKIILAASLAFALAGCLSVPVTRTAANDEACIETTMNTYSGTGQCESLHATWGRAGHQESTRNKVSAP